jgi:hypothetical protein
VSGIFLNYRRGDHAGLVAAVDRRLAEHFGRQQVFLDTESIGGGERYPDTLRDRVAGADVLLAMIHRGWAEASDEAGRRLDQQGDWVRQELEIALAGQRAGRTIVIPVLLDDAAEPVAAELPGSLRELALCQARRIRLHSWLPDIEALIPELERHAAATWQPLDAPAAEQPRRPRRPGRWVAAVVGILAALLLAVPAVLAVNDPVPAAGSVPAQFMAAMWLLAFMSAPFLANVVVFLSKGWVNQIERHLHRAAPGTYYGRVALPIVGVFTLFGVASGLLDRSWPQVATGLAIGFLGLFWAGARSFQEEDRDAERRASWPYRLPTPLDIPSLRRAVAVCQQRLDNFARPLTRQQREQAEWTLDAIDEGVRTLREPFRRRDWLADRWRWSAGYVLWVAVTIGLGVAGAVPALAADPPRFRVLLGTAFVTVVALLFSLGTMELVYRRRRWERHAAAGETAARVARLRQRLHDLRAPTP